MNAQAKYITTDGQITFVQPVNGKSFTLEEIYRFVGKPAEFLHPPGQSGVLMICNEIGKISGLPFNPVATEIWQYGCDLDSPRKQDFIVGNVLLCHENQMEED